MQAAYPISLTLDGDDLVVRSRDLPELLTAGSTESEALENAEDALAVTVLTYMEKGTPPPAPSAPVLGERMVYLPAYAAAKWLVWQSFMAAGISKSELARRMNVAITEAQRVLDPNHSSKLERLEQAARALGTRLTVSSGPIEPYVAASDECLVFGPKEDVLRELGKWTAFNKLAPEQICQALLHPDAKSSGWLVYPTKESAIEMASFRCKAVRTPDATADPHEVAVVFFTDVHQGQKW